MPCLRPIAYVGVSLVSGTSALAAGESVIAPTLSSVDREAEPAAFHPDSVAPRVSRRWGPYALRVAFELVVVFVGVFGAMLADEYREREQRRERARHIYQALLKEMDIFVGPGAQVAAEMTRRLAAYATAARAGERPVPAHYREPRAEAPPSAAWAATMASGGVQLIDPPLFYRLADHYNLVTSIGDRYQRYNAFTERDLLTRLPEGSAAFYDARSGRLRPEFQAHMERLAELRDELAGALEAAQALRAELAARAGDGAVAVAGSGAGG